MNVHHRVHHHHVSNQGIHHYTMNQSLYTNIIDHTACTCIIVHSLIFVHTNHWPIHKQLYTDIRCTLYKLIIVLLHTTYHCTLYKHKSHFTCSSTLTYYCTIYIVHHTIVHICTPTHVHSSLFILFNNFMPTYLYLCKLTSSLDCLYILLVHTCLYRYIPC